MNKTLGQIYLAELESEYTATKKCIEAVPETAYDFKPHEKSMNLGSLVLMSAEIPQWIALTIEQGVIDFATYPRFTAKNTADMSSHFDECMAMARKALSSVSDEQMTKPFELKMSGKLLFSQPTGDSIMSSLNHWVHHRGQLTVYLRLNGLKVPSIYGPSGDEGSF